MEAEQLIKEYKFAYEAANGKPSPDVRYERGWFRVGHPSTPCRKRELMRWRDVLLDRAAHSNGDRASG